MQLDLKAVGEAIDGSLYQHDHQLTSSGEPICLNEYAADIAATETTHVLLLLDF